MVVWTRVVRGDGEKSSNYGYIALGIQGWLHIFWPERLGRVALYWNGEGRVVDFNWTPMGDVNLIVICVGLELKEEVLEGDISLSVVSIFNLSLQWAQNLLYHQCPAWCLAHSLCSVSIYWMSEWSHSVTGGDCGSLFQWVLKCNSLKLFFFFLRSHESLIVDPMD